MTSTAVSESFQTIAQWKMTSKTIRHLKRNAQRAVSVSNQIAALKRNERY